MTPGVDVPGVTAWFAATLDAAPPLDFRALPGGRSNLTYLVTDRDGRRYVLRRPPLGALEATAHDVTREARILAALAKTAVPVPAVLGVEADPSVTGAPFFVMTYVAGGELSPAGRVRAGDALVDTLVALHAVDPVSVGLGDLGRPDGYFARQLRRWHGQWEAYRTRDLPALGAAHARLVARVPEQRGTALVHGDFRLDNCLLSPTGEVRAVLDWEIATRGDPVADLGLLLVYWAEPGDPVTALADPPTRYPGFATRDRLRERYLSATGTDPGALDFAVAFAWWKLACIVEGVYARLVRGAAPVTDRAPGTFADQAARLADMALELTGRWPRTPGA
jgi:aminoglycoside phosphotransferase (APT) family kinase protein